MPRKSGISLTIVPPTFPGKRPAAPAALDAAERRVWEAIAGALSLTWFDGAALQVLLRAVAQGAVCESLEAQLRALRAQDPPDTDRRLGGPARRRGQQLFATDDHVTSDPT